MNALVICSGGMDSIALAHKIAAERALTRPVSFDYGQRHKKELDSTRACAARFGVPQDVKDVIDISAVRRLLTGSALTDSGSVPKEHHAEDLMRIAVVPNRNAIMLAIAFGIAAAEQAESVAAAVHGDDRFIYPDYHPDFVEAFATTPRHAFGEMPKIALYTPFIRRVKADIVREGARLGVPCAETWSCSQGGDHHCGRCGTCLEWREAFLLADVEDPTPYEKPDYWVEACREHQEKQPSRGSELAIAGPMK
ncbi:7-cyano-7-deazaguanine synthase QueC [Microvirga sp. VF16]|uniref:7-cyano-7-deazaguanine synthase QueC n=1 Tax=Microvirga sp. VF16 TaxID=2807101 RepID=UPI00193E1DD6|nr:7-cyano-7-deazaguanine synthase QueC [Microvirga sp. VF16]QRM32310.1 7-cyano-7-deazaguanine synthase QueC [Microvirga sp. VF16]